MEPSNENARLCGKLVQRFQGTRYFQTLNEDALQMLSEALLSACAGPTQAEMVVSLWLSQHAEYPTPADICQIAYSLNTEEPSMPTYQTPGVSRCLKCADTGWEQVFGKDTRGTEVTGVRKCCCGAAVRGQYEDIQAVAR